jgi:hypothetical protein
LGGERGGFYQVLGIRGLLSCISPGCWRYGISPVGRDDSGDGRDDRGDGRDDRGDGLVLKMDWIRITAGLVGMTEVMTQDHKGGWFEMTEELGRDNRMRLFEM